MSRVPRASLCITLLDDEDYRVLMASKGGLEAFGLFVALIVVGRERLQQGQAKQLPDGDFSAPETDSQNRENANLLQPSMSDSLRFDNSTTHILAMAHATSKQLDRCLNVLKAVAEDTGSKPWMYLDETKHLVIRSFFKFNTTTGWGGNRPGSGRPPKKNQVDSQDNQVDSESNPSRILSGTGTGTGTNALTSVAPVRAHAGAGENGTNGFHVTCHGSHQEAVEVALELFGDSAAESISKGKVGIEAKILGEDDRPRWDYYVEALRHADAYRNRPGSEKIRSLNGFCIDRVREWSALGIVPGPVEIEPVMARAAPPEKPWELPATF